MTDGIELDQLRSANLQAWSRDTTLPDYALVANTSSSRYIPALEARVEELQAQLAEAQLRLIETQNGRTDM